jgi:hypothetical protein
VTLRENVFENRVLRSLLQSRRGELIGGCRKFHNEELHHLSFSSNIMGMFKSRKMRREVRVACMGEKSIKSSDEKKSERKKSRATRIHK